MKVTCNQTTVLSRGTGVERRSPDTEVAGSNLFKGEIHIPSCLANTGWDTRGIHQA